MSTSELESALAHALTLSMPADKKTRTGSLAISVEGNVYSAGYVASQTHVLDISSEHAALVRALQHNDVMIREVHTISSEPTALVSPLVLKVLADHSTRTGVAIRYVLRDADQSIRYEVADARAALPFYQMPAVPLDSIVDRHVSPGISRLDSDSQLSSELQLRDWALKGLSRNFPTRDGASGYGSAVLTATGEIYFGGQYSSFDKRLNVHAEMAVLLNALVSGSRNIIHIAVASSKFIEEPCSPCGCCRQFIAELAQEYTFSPTLDLFASGNESFVSYTIDELLPVQWSNKK